MYTLPRLGRWVFAVLAIGMVPAHGGFDVPRMGITGVPLGGSRADKDLLDLAYGDDRPYPPIEVPIPPADLAKLKLNAKFSHLSNLQIHRKVINMRIAVLCAIDLIKRENRKIGDGLDRLNRGGLICIGLTLTDLGVAAAIKNDGKVKFNVEPINIYRLPCTRLEAWSPALFELTNTLAHEGLHAVQNIGVRKGGTVLELALRIQIAEIEASEAELKRTCEMLRVLNAMSATGEIPSNASGMQLKMASELLKRFRKDPLGRQAAITAFQKRCLLIKARATAVRDFRKLNKRAAEMAIAGNPNAAQIRAELLKHRLFKRYRRQGEFGVIANFYFNDAGEITIDQLLKNRKMRQLLPPEFEQEESFDVIGVDSICDVLIVADLNFALIGGVDDAEMPGEVDMGVIVKIDLDPVTGLMLPGTQRESYRSAMLGSGFALARNEFESSDPFYAMKRPGGEIFRFFDTDGDDCPDSASMLGGFAIPSGEELIDIQFVAQHEAVGLATDEDTVQAEDEPLRFAFRMAPGLDFEPGVTGTLRNEIVMRPSLDGIAYVGLETLPVAGTPNSRFEIFYSDPVEQVGEGCISPTGRGLVDLSSPVPSDREIFLDDLDTGLRSESFICAPRPTGLVVLDAKFIEIDLTIGWRLEFEPNRKVVWKEGPDLATAQEVGCDTTNAWGQAYRNVNLEGAPPTSFIIAQVPPDPPLGGTPDIFTAVPGLPSVFDVSANDGAVAGTQYFLGTDPGLHPERFKFNRDGTFTVSLLTFGGEISFTYRQMRAGNLGPPITVLVARDISALTDPPVLNGPGGPWVEAPVLLLAPVPLLAQYYPLYQFVLGNNPADECVDPHWHAFSPVSPIADPLLNVPDPDEFNCGFGLRRDHPPTTYLMTLAQWNNFKSLNPP